MLPYTTAITVEIRVAKKPMNRDTLPPYQMQEKISRPSVSVLIKNYYAPVDKKENGLLNVRLKEKDIKSEISNEFNMTMAEWLNVVEQMELSKNTFYTLNFNSALKMAEDADKQNRATAAENRTNSNK